LGDRALDTEKFFAPKDAAALLGDRALRSLQRLAITRPFAAALANRRAWVFERLVELVIEPSPRELEPALVAVLESRIPRLETLSIAAAGAAPILATTRAKRVQLVDRDFTAIASWLGEPIESAYVRELRFVGSCEKFATSGAAVMLRPGRDGAWSDLTVEWTGTGWPLQRDRLLAALRHQAKALTSLDIGDGPPGDRTWASDIREALS